MPRLTRRERFTDSKCDRCGKATPARQNGIGDLYVLDEKYGEGVAGQGSFCLRCATRYSREDWLAWLAEHRAPTSESEGGLQGMPTSRYGARRGSVSGSFKAYRVEYSRTNVFSGLTEWHKEIIYARTQGEADRKATKKFGKLPGASIEKVLCVERQGDKNDEVKARYAASREEQDA